MSPHHYLLLDDDPAFAQTLARALSRRGNRCTLCSDLDELAPALAAQRFERAIVDLKIADQSGLCAIDAIRQAQPQCAILMLTGYASIVTAVEAIKRGAVQYLPKPADATEILRAFTGEPGALEAPAPPSVERLEYEHIQRILHEHDGNISATARALNMHRRTLQRKLAKNPVAR